MLAFITVLMKPTMLAFITVLMVIALPVENITFFKNKPQYVTADTLYGTVRGLRHNVTDRASLETFLGVPYARPPVGLLRFSRPQFPEPWEGTKDALQFGNQCFQNTVIDPEIPPIPFSEDCLTLNIYSPTFSDRTDKLPVMVWIHGGAYTFGTGSIYNMTELALRGVVVVTINYRLDVFGFLSTADTVIPGNFGMLDQVLALDWVKDNIHSFGGDPEAVTIAGQSAGGSSVSLHLLSPLSRGKFHGAIMESGTSLCPWALTLSNTTYYAPHDMAHVFGLAVGCTHPASPELLACLRTTNAQVLLNASISLQKTLKNAMVWRPVVEATFNFLPDLPENLFRKGKVADVPTIRGYNKNEMAGYVIDPKDEGFSEKEFQDLVIENAYFYYQKMDAEVVEDIEEVYSANRTDPKGRRAVFERILTDRVMVAPISFEAIWHSKLQKQSKSYLYEFSYRATFDPSPEWKGIKHSAELPFVLGLPRGPDMLKFNTTNPNDIQVANSMVTMWTNFIKTGNPASAGTSPFDRIRPPALDDASTTDPIVWPALNDKANSVMEITTSLISGDFLRAKAVDLWMVRIPELQK